MFVRLIGIDVDTSCQPESWCSLAVPESGYAGVGCALADRKIRALPPGVGDG